MASRAIGATVPPLCSFWMDLVPYRNEKGNPQFVNVGHGTHVLPFTADFELSPDLENRFVGMSNFLRFQELRKNELISWESEWDKSGESVSSKSENGRTNGGDIHPMTDEEMDALIQSTGSF